ncbi:BQ2448_3060 [Microbotryum intermedium]|uniref:BQ2448_3060 protein n=1 Tax=Microbotryum intermedium TaxID=269621 RepID=A0A238FCA6_9BASI|nr:BQ2448_3060 [Microbotryum intermedium]
MFKPCMSTSPYAHNPMEGVFGFAVPSSSTVAAPMIALQSAHSNNRRNSSSAVRLLPLWAARSSSIPTCPLPLPSSTPARTVTLEWAMSRDSAPAASTSSLPRTRQTRISDHLKTIKASSSSPKPKQLAAVAPASSDSVMGSTKATATPKSIAAKTRRSARSTRSTPEIDQVQAGTSPVVEQLPTGSGKAQGWSDEHASPQQPRLQSHQALEEQHTLTDAHPQSLASTSTTRISTRSSGKHALGDVGQSGSVASTETSTLTQQAPPSLQRVAPTSSTGGGETLGRRSLPIRSAPPHLEITTTDHAALTFVSLSTKSPFLTLESPSTPTYATTRARSHRRQSSTSTSTTTTTTTTTATTVMPSPASSCSTQLPPPSTPPSRDGSFSVASAASRSKAGPSTPSSQQNVRLLAFSNPRSSTSFVPELMPALHDIGVGSSSGTQRSFKDKSSLVAAHVEGMGRVALSRDILFEHFGSRTAERAIAAAAANSANAASPTEELPPLKFGKGAEALGDPIEFQAFRPAAPGRRRSPSFVPRRGGGKMGAHKVDARIGKVKSWLESDDEEDVENVEAVAWSGLPRKADDWDIEPHGIGREALISKRLEPEIEVRTVQESDADDSSAEVEQLRVRVGGKNITALLVSKKRRVQEDEDGNDAPADDEASDELVDEPSKSRSSKGKRRAVEASCDCEDEAHTDVCPTRDATAAAVFGRPPKTPTLSRSEPMFSASSLSPRPTHYFLSSGPDMALAPSPQASPSPRRRSQPSHPHSPTNPTVSVPVTPQFNQPRADYSPRSPLFYRSARMRMMSGQFEDPSQAHHATGGWTAGWDGTNSGYEDPNSFPAISFQSSEEDEWHDLTLTPTRALGSSSSFSWAETMLSPNASGRRSRVPSGVALMGATSASQDFLGALHHERVPSNGAFSATMASHVAQRLFSATSPTQTHQHLPAFAGQTSSSYSSSASHQSALGHHRTPSTPFSARQHVRSNSHRRAPSSSSWLHPESVLAPAPIIEKPPGYPFSPSPSAASDSPANLRGLSSTPMQVSSSAPVWPTTPNQHALSSDMAKSASGHEMDFIHSSMMLDDYMMS